ncbi:MAG: hypothetical protein ACLUFV_10595 [Acutalibacteraceae bacterium]
MMELIETVRPSSARSPSAAFRTTSWGKGVIRRIRELRREANIVPIDYDPGAARVNQENRIVDARRRA